MTAVAEPAAQREIGRDRRRKEDRRLITGRTRWTDNITLPGMLHLAMVRSPFAHAKIVSVDTSAAKQATNVVDVAGAAHDEPRVLLAPERLADPLGLAGRVLQGGHAATSCPEAASTALTMLW